MPGPGDGGYQVVGGGQSGFVGGTVDERPVLDVGVPVAQPAAGIEGVAFSLSQHGECELHATQ